MIPIFHKNNRLTGLTLSLASVFTILTGTVQYYAHCLPDHLYAETDRPVSVATLLPMTVHSKEPSVPEVQEAELRLFGMFPVKTVSLTAVQPVSLFVGGEPFGVRMRMDGVMVVSLREISTADGAQCPAKDAGIEVGDMIRAVNGREITGNSDLQEAVTESGGEPVRIQVLRDDSERTVAVQPVFSDMTKRWQTGMWVRDSTAGIGTVTYYQKAPDGVIRFAGLGHAVCDADTGEQIPLAEGDVVSVDVTSVVPGQAGKPGELRGHLDSDQPIGALLANTAGGVYGTVSALPAHRLYLPLGYRQDIRRGEAQIYTTIHGETPSAYTVEIEEIRDRDTAMRNLVIHVTDETLLEKTGGIVQGMSGSPIVQNGRLVGAVTHVFVKDPTRGYGIFAENMYQ